jgi:hypothetical protein
VEVVLEAGEEVDRAAQVAVSLGAQVAVDWEVQEAVSLWAWVSLEIIMETRKVGDDNRCPR